MCMHNLSVVSFTANTRLLCSMIVRLGHTGANRDVSIALHGVGGRMPKSWAQLIAVMRCLCWTLLRELCDHSHPGRVQTFAPDSHKRLHIDWYMSSGRFAADHCRDGWQGGETPTAGSSEQVR